jgi:hypothetical protein
MCVPLPEIQPHLAIIKFTEEAAKPQHNQKHKKLALHTVLPHVNINITVCYERMKAL